MSNGQPTKQSDIIQRLRNPAYYSNAYPGSAPGDFAPRIDGERARADMAEAADEIERLRAIIGRAHLAQEDCDHAEYAFAKHGRCCSKCGIFMVDFGD